MLADQPAVLKRHPVGLGELQVGDARRGLRRHLPAAGEPVLVDAGEPEEAVLALGGDRGRRAVGTEEIVDVEFIERDQARDPRATSSNVRVSERCLARDSARRACNLGKVTAAPASAAADSDRIGRDESMPPALAGPSNRIMTVRGLISALTQQEDLNFLLTNRIPRAALTRFMGWFSKIENPLVRDASIACWRMFSDLDLSEAKKTEFKSLHDCFTRELKPGLRPPDPDPSIVVSPCDAIIGAHRRDRRIPNCSRSRARPIRCSICSAIPSWWTRTAMDGSSRCG